MLDKLKLLVLFHNIKKKLFEAKYCQSINNLRTDFNSPHITCCIGPEAPGCLETFVNCVQNLKFYSKISCVYFQMISGLEQQLFLQWNPGIASLWVSVRYPIFSVRGLGLFLTVNSQFNLILEVVSLCSGEFF